MNGFSPHKVSTMRIRLESAEKSLDDVVIMRRILARLERPGFSGYPAEVSFTGPEGIRSIGLIIPKDAMVEALRNGIEYRVEQLEELAKEGVDIRE